MIDIVWEIPLKMPDYRLDERALTDMGKAIEATALNAIKTQTKLDGTPIKKNSYAYAKQKSEAGWGSRSLVAKDHSLVKGKGASFTTTVDVAASTVTVAPAAGDAEDRSGWVQEKGYTGWFGLSEKTVQDIKEILAAFIRRATAKAKGR